MVKVVEISELADELGVPVQDIELARNVFLVIQRTYQASPTTAASMLMRSRGDARQRSYAFRAMIFDDLNDLKADTDPDLPHDSYDFSTVVDSLDQVAVTCAHMSAQFAPSLDPEQLLAAFRSRLQVLRNAMSRSIGRPASWRIPFAVNGQRYTMRVDCVADDAKRKN